MAAEPILQMKQIVKNYPGVQALKAVDFSLLKGEVHALVGQNGAGKSTLVEIIAGSIQFDSGEIYLDNRKYEHPDPSRSIDSGIQTVHQENQLVEEITVAENIFLYNLPRTKYGFVNLSSCIAAADSLLRELGIPINSAKKISSLTFVEKKLISIAKAFSSNAKVLILDEPTASLDESGKKVLFSLIRKYTELGMSTIYISHHLGEIFEVCDRVTVIKDGRRISSRIITQTDMHQIVQEMIGKSSDTLYVRKKLNLAGEPGAPKLEFADFHRQGAVHHVSFSITAGEVFGIAGLVGSGRTELAQMIFGIDKKQSGKILLDGEDITPKNPYEAIAQGFGFLTEDRKETGLVLMHPVVENITLVQLVKKTAVKMLNLAEEGRSAQQVVQQLDIKTPTVYQKVINLSGGNQQKVVLGKWLFADSRIIIFDEPTVGVDVGSKSEIYKLIDKLAGEGKFIIIISSDNPELVSVCDRVGVMRFGSLAVQLQGRDITEENIVRHSLGVGSEKG